MSDRSLQDDVIRALADASYRRSAAWQQRALADGDRVDRFARFLARHFYYERVLHFFKYSRALGRVTGRRPQEMIRTGAFDAVLPEIVMGSRATARRVAALVTEYVEGGPGVDRVPYLGDLLRYETAMMIADAGPRDWTGNGAAAKVDGRAVPEVVEGTQVVDFGFDLPHVFRELPGAWSEVPVPPRRPLRLLFARSPEGRVAVVRPPGEALRLLEFAGRGRTVEELARRGGFDETTARAGVADLVELGALRFATGS